MLLEGIVFVYRNVKNKEEYYGENERIIDKKLSEITGGMTEEEYYAEYEKYGPLDTEEHILQGGRCPECHKNTLRFWRYQPGPFGNKEAVYVCDECHEYQITVLRK